MVPDEEDVTPLGFLVANNCWDTVRLLLEQCRYPRFMHETKLNYTLRAAIRKGGCQFRTLIIHSGQDSESVLVCITTPDPSYSSNTAVREINVFLNLLEGDKRVEKSVVNSIFITLINQSMRLNTAVAFKAIWKQNRMQYKVAYTQPKFLYEFLTHCNFRNVEFIESLKLILDSRYVRYLIQMPSDTTIYKALFRYFQARNVDKQDRIVVILRTVQLVKVTFSDFISASAFFEFNEEVVILLQYFNSKDLTREDYSTVFDFITYLLEDDPKLRIENLNKLDLVAATSYRKLLNSVPEDLFDDNEVIKLKKRVLNQVPTLAASSTYAFQKCLQNTYQVNDVNQFNKIVGNLSLPKAIKDSLCQKPPIYYMDK